MFGFFKRLAFSVAIILFIAPLLTFVVIWNLLVYGGLEKLQEKMNTLMFIVNCKSGENYLEIDFEKSGIEREEIKDEKKIETIRNALFDGKDVEFKIYQTNF